MRSSKIPGRSARPTISSKNCRAFFFLRRMPGKEGERGDYRGERGSSFIYKEKARALFARRGSARQFSARSADVRGRPALSLEEDGMRTPARGRSSNSSVNNANARELRDYLPDRPSGPLGPWRTDAPESIPLCQARKCRKEDVRILPGMHYWVIPAMLTEKTFALRMYHVGCRDGK